MTTTDCPFCDQPVELDLAVDVEAHCGDCLIRVELAPEPAPPIVIAAAA